MRDEIVSPSLLTAYEDWTSQELEEVARMLGPLGIVGEDLASARPARSVVFVRCDNDKDFAPLEQQGVVVNSPAGEVRTAILPLEALPYLSEEPGIQEILGSHQLRPLMDIVPSQIDMPTYQQNHGPSVGKDVVVGIVDSGIDPAHTAFANRISRIWDQTIPGGPGVPEGAYGQEFTAGHLAGSADANGHGTHVAGIAAGAHPQFAGIAPGATLVVVKTDMNNAHVADGVRYVFRVAKDLELPAVVNLSLGGHSDAHDGSDGLSSIIDNESGPGRIVCCAAGNEGNDDIHAEAQIAVGQTETIEFRVPSGTRKAIVNAWYSGQTSAEIAVSAPSGLQTPFRGIMQGGTQLATFFLGTDRVRLLTPGPNAANGDHNAVVVIDGGPPTLTAAAGTWRLHVRGVAGPDSELHAWALDNNRFSDVTFRGRAATDRLKIGSPGCAAEAITVASYTSRSNWTDINGDARGTSLPLNTISDFSSEGPLRDLARKPDLAAPGAFVVAPFSSAASVSDSMKITADFRVNAGTSMACPVVTGLVALMLERNRHLTPAQAKQDLQAVSAIPGQAAGAFDPKWGYGLINAGNL